MIEEQSDIQVPGHRILRQLGRGGMANVYLALQESMEREVALKVMLPALGASDPTFSERFVREAKIIAKLSHPHINAVYDVGVAGPYHYFTMEYLTGGDLKTRIRHGMAPAAALAIARQVTSALAFAHTKGYVHRDVKPENVLFRDSGTAVLTDFGIAKGNDVSHTMTATGTVIGTPHYMSPEQAMGRAIDKRADLYSLGVMIFEMLTGSVPFSGDSAISIGMQHLKEPIPQLPTALRAFQSFLEKCLAKTPAQRFQTGEEVIAAIDALAPGTSSTGPVGVQRTVALSPIAHTQRTEATESDRAPWRRGVILTSALLALSILGAAYFVFRSAPPPSVASTPVSTAIAPATPAMPANDTAPRAAEVARLLAEAESAANTGHYLEPAGAAAVPKFRQVLALDPENAHAARALSEIAGQFISDAERAIEGSRFDQAEEFLNRAEQADRGHPMLFSRRLALKEYREEQAARAAARIRRQAGAETKPRVAAQAPSSPTRASAPALSATRVEDSRVREQREREQELQTLLSRFRNMVEPTSLSATRTEIAHGLLSEAARIAPNDQRVRALPAQLADAYLKLATDKAREQRYEDAETLIRRGLELVPSHRELNALQEDVSNKKDSDPPTFSSF